MSTTTRNRQVDESRWWRYRCTCSTAGVCWRRLCRADISWWETWAWTTTGWRHSASSRRPTCASRHTASRSTGSDSPPWTPSTTSYERSTTKANRSPLRICSSRRSLCNAHSRYYTIQCKEVSKEVFFMAPHVRSQRAPCSCFPKKCPFSCRRNSP